ncbi:glucosaminidase domain-containing protein [Actinokineospora globicatena]|uniref:Mannosyl-glycoprotein endo-beta-N-acetylglucosamidase-like domain-containing protein n=1 Tax=Actinokineospora globicatena TaxID=103729 RepID=A0A9W6QM66_9PSEU|nr:glucosaminidase domain-containing protein [Actinokineospora globicatena]GLW91117.1 hypothetical protein Aglo03_19330 [Actinokineospora globicatena]
MSALIGKVAATVLAAAAGTVVALSPASAATAGEPAVDTKIQKATAAQAYAEAQAAATPSQNAYIAVAGPAAQRVQVTYNIPASVTVAQSILESGWGTSGLTSVHKNYFGFKCASPTNPGPIAIGCRNLGTEECTPNCHGTTAYFRVHRSMEDSFRDYGRLLTTSSLYAHALPHRTDPDRFIQEIGWRYATDPNYANKIITLMRDHDLYRFNAPITPEPPAAPPKVRSVVTAGGNQAFGIAPDGHVISTFWSADITTNGGWHDWFRIPTGYADGVAGLNATVTATTLNGTRQLFTVAADGRVISTFWSAGTSTNGGWHKWFPIQGGHNGGVVAPNAVVTALGDQIYSTAPDGRVMSTFWSADITTNGGWHDWFVIPGGAGDGVTAPNSVVTATTLNGAPQLFTTAADGRVISTFWSANTTTNGGWSGWFTIPGGHQDGKTRANSVVGVLGNQLYTTALDGRVMSTFWSANTTTNGGWSGWFTIPTGYADGTTAPNTSVTAATVNGTPQLFTTAPDGHVISTFWSAGTTTNGGWHEWFTIPTGYADGDTAPNSAIGITTLNDQAQLFTIAANGHVISTFWSAQIPTNGGWHEWFPLPGGTDDGLVRV